jgi:hypothetical protein
MSDGRIIGVDAPSRPATPAVSPAQSLDGIVSHTEEPGAVAR